MLFVVALVLSLQQSYSCSYGALSKISTQFAALHLSVWGKTCQL